MSLSLSPQRVDVALTGNRIGPYEVLATLGEGACLR
jgi:hypothetical protein